MSQTMREALEWTAAALQEVFRTNHNCSEHDRIVIGGSSATVREILNRADAALSAPSSEQAQQGADGYAEAHSIMAAVLEAHGDCPHSTGTSNWAHWVGSRVLASRPAAAAPAVGVTDPHGHRAFSLYLEDCDKHAIEPDAAGAFHWLWANRASPTPPTGTSKEGGEHGA